MGFFRDLLFGTPSKPAAPVPPSQPKSSFEIRDGVLRGYNGSGGTVTIPEGVTKIGMHVFMNNASIQHVIIPSGVTEIENSAFLKCVNLRSVTIPDTVKTIGVAAFGSCSSLTEIHLPKEMTKLGYSALRRTAIQKIEIPVGLTKIDSQTFEECPNLTDVTFASGSMLKEIGGCAFGTCPRLKEISIPETVRKIGYSAFENCVSLSVVSLPKNIETIEEDAFTGCKRLWLLVHPESPLIDVMTRRRWNVRVIEPTPQKAAPVDHRTRLLSLSGTYCINHKMGKGDWPLLASNGTMDLFTQRELVEAYIRKVKRNIEVCFIPKPFLESYLKSWYAKGIRKIMVDDHNYEVLNISDLLDATAFPNTLHPTLELARTLVTFKQCEEDNEHFLAGIIGGNVRNMLPKTVFLTLLKGGVQKTEGISCSSLAREIMERAGVNTLPGLESDNIAGPNIKHDDMQSFQYEGKKVVYLFTDMNELKSVAGEDSTFGIVAYGDVAYRIMNPESCGELNAGIINPAGLKCWIY